jgi:hypothetical protein
MPFDNILDAYKEDPNSISFVQRRQIEDCPLIQRGIKQRLWLQNEHEKEQKRLKEDPDYAAFIKAKTEEQLKRIQKMHEDNRPDQEYLDKMDMPMEDIDEDKIPQPGDVWSTKTFLPWDDGKDSGVRRLYFTPDVLLLRELAVYVDDVPGPMTEWIVCPVESEFLLLEHVVEDLEKIKFAPKYIDGSPWLDQVAFPHFKVRMAVGQLDKPKFSSHIDPFELETYCPMWFKDEDVAHGRIPFLPNYIKCRLTHGNPYALTQEERDERDPTDILHDMGTIGQWGKLWADYKLLESSFLDHGDDKTLFLYEQSLNPQNKKEVQDA